MPTSRRCPPHLVGEILFGHLVTHPRPTRRHGGSGECAGHGVVTGSYQFGIGGPGGWIFVDEPELHLGPHVVVPDIAGWRRERMTEPADKAYFEVAPDWVCEILSPSTEKYDKGDKRRIYAHVRGRAPLACSTRGREALEVFAAPGAGLAADPYFLRRGRGCQRTAVRPSSTFSLGLLWPFDPPSDTTTETST